jgi:hypothetical protein
MKTIVFLMLAMAGPLLAADVSLLTKPQAVPTGSDALVAVTNGAGVALIPYNSIATQWTNTARAISKTNNTTGNAATATVASYVSGTLSNSITGNAGTSTLASYVSGTLTNPIPAANLTGGITSSATSNVLSVTDAKTTIENGSADTLVVTNSQVGIGKVPTSAWGLDVARSLNAAYINSGGSVVASAGSVFQHSGRNRWNSPADGTMTWTKADDTTILMSNTNGTLYVNGGGITDIPLGGLSTNGATTGYVPKFNGTTVAWAADETAEAGSGIDAETATAIALAVSSTNSTTGNSLTATVASYVSGTLSNWITGNALTATTATYLSGAPTNLTGIATSAQLQAATNGAAFLAVSNTWSGGNYFGGEAVFSSGSFDQLLTGLTNSVLATDANGEMTAATGVVLQAALGGTITNNVSGLIDGGDFILTPPLGQIAGLWMDMDFNAGWISGVKDIIVQDAADPANNIGRWNTNGLWAPWNNMTNATTGLTIEQRVDAATNNLASVAHTGKVVYNLTTAAVPVSPVFTAGVNYMGFTTNAAFAFADPTGVSATEVRQCVVAVTNSTASAVAITLPASVWSQGTGYVTNVTICSFTSWAGQFTNCVFLPLK